MYLCLLITRCMMDLVFTQGPDHHFKEIVEAYAILGSTAKRAEYDAQHPSQHDFEGVDSETGRRWAREASAAGARPKAQAWSPRHAHAGTAAGSDWATFDFDEWNRMHFGPSTTAAGKAARDAAEQYARRSRAGDAAGGAGMGKTSSGGRVEFQTPGRTGGAAGSQPYADRARTETDYHWRRLHRLRQARTVRKWAVPMQIVVFAAVGVGVWAVTGAALGGAPG